MHDKTVLYFTLTGCHFLSRVLVTITLITLSYERAFTEARKVLDEGDLLAIFPEGGITKDGSLGEFKGGIMKILQTHPVPVVPMALNNLWGSFFSRVERGTAMVKPFRRGVLSPVGLVVGPAVAPADVSPPVLRERVARLMEAGVPA